MLLDTCWQSSFTSISSVRFATVITEPFILVRERDPTDPLIRSPSHHENGFIPKLVICNRFKSKLTLQKSNLWILPLRDVLVSRLPGGCLERCPKHINWSRGTSRASAWTSTLLYIHYITWNICTGTWFFPPLLCTQLYFSLQPDNPISNSAYRRGFFSFRPLQHKSNLLWPIDIQKTNCKDSTVMKVCTAHH